DVFLKNKTSASVKVSSNAAVKSGSNVSVALTSADVPNDAGYSLSSVTYIPEGGDRRNRQPLSASDYSYSNGRLTLTEAKAGTYTVTFVSSKYADMSVSFTVTDYYATTDMTWAEFYAGEVGKTSADLYADGLDAVSSPTARIANSFSQLTSESNDIKGRSITGVKAVQVRMTGEVYNLLSNDKRYTFSNDVFAEYKPVNADGSFGAMVTEYHVQEGAIVSLTAPGAWGDYVLAVSSIDITVGSGGRDASYYLGALVETADGKVYGMRHNNNLWFGAGELAISTAEFVEVHGVSRSYEYTSDMEGKTIKKITYMLKNLPDEIVSCDVFLKLRTSASVSPVYETGYHAVMASQNTKVQLKFADLPESSDYQLAGVTFGTGQGRKAVDGCTFKDGILTISGDAQEGTYSARFTDEKYMDISAVIKVYTTLVTSKIVSSANNPAELTFLLTPKGVCDSTDAVLDAQNFVNATEYTVSADNSTSIYTEGKNQIEGSGFSLNVKLKDVPEGKMAILGFSKNLEITPAKIGSAEFSSMSQKILALPDVAYGWRVPTAEQLKDLGLTVTAVYPDGVSRDVTGYISSGLFPTDESITFSFGTVLIDRAFTPSEEGKVYLLSEEGEGTMSDGAHDGNITATWFVSFTGSQKGNQDTPSNPNNTVNPNNTDNQSDNTVIARNTVTPSAPSMPMTEAVQSVIKEALGKLSGKISADTPVAVLPETAVKGYQSVASVDSSAVYLPVIVVTEAKIYVFGVSLDKFAAGSPIYWNSNATDVNTGEFVSAADDEEAVTFFDDNGDETSIVPYPPLKKHVNVAAYLEPEREYSPTITTSKNTSTEEGVGSAGGGCDTGFAVPLMLLGLLYAFRSGRRF
ncbi:MAG: hypothetical protein IJ587_07715, partial [Synergistaceae bacterium]|nr:hypothetical protein [Synergistaceae bacterium]